MMAFGHSRPDPQLLSTTLRDPNAWRLENEPCLSRYKKQNAKIPGGRKVLEKKLPNTLTAHCVRFWGAPTMATEAWPRSVAPTPAFLQPKPLPPPRLHTGPPTGRHATPRHARWWTCASRSLGRQRGRRTLGALTEEVGRCAEVGR